MCLHSTKIDQQMKIAKYYRTLHFETLAGPFGL